METIIKKEKIVKLIIKPIAFFPVKANPPHLGHILTLLRIKDDYRKIMISVLDVNLFITSKEIIEILKFILNNYPNKFYFNIHKESFITRTNFDELPFDREDIIVTGNKKVYDNVKKYGLKAKLIARIPYYKSADIRNNQRKVNK